MSDFKPKTIVEAQEIVTGCFADAKSVEVVGRETKRNFANACEAEHKLSTALLRGINFYEPAELAISVKAGTSLTDVEIALFQANQRLAFEPPRLSKLFFGHTKAGPSIGGLVASNLSGPARVNRGALRDHLLGVEFINGKGQAVKSGGRVMKNVTGYDLCKLLAGSWGTLGVLSNVVLKTLPKMETETTLLIACETAFEAGRLMRQAMGTPFDVISTAYVNGSVAIRVEGLRPSVEYRIGELQDELEGKDKSQLEGQASIDFWADVREVSDFLPVQDQVWKISVAPTDGPEILDSLVVDESRSGFLDWSGGLVWIGCRDGDVCGELEPWLRGTAGGHATLVKGQDDLSRNALPSRQHALMQQIKATFDPKGILSPNRMR